MDNLTYSDKFAAIETRYGHQYILRELALIRTKCMKIQLQTIINITYDLYICNIMPKKKISGFVFHRIDKHISRVCPRFIIKNVLSNITHQLDYIEQQTNTKQILFYNTYDFQMVITKVYSSCVFIKNKINLVAASILHNLNLLQNSKFSGKIAKMISLPEINEIDIIQQNPDKLDMHIVPIQIPNILEKMNDLTDILNDFSIVLDVVKSELINKIDINQQFMC